MIKPFYVTAATCDYSPSLYCATDGGYMRVDYEPRVSFVEYAPTQKKYRCQHCGGKTIDDEVGNCAACGAPRLAPKRSQPIHGFRTKSHEEPDYQLVTDDDYEEFDEDYDDED